MARKFIQQKFVTMICLAAQNQNSGFDNQRKAKEKYEYYIY